MSQPQLQDNALRVVALMKAAYQQDHDGYLALNPPSHPDSELIDALVGYALGATSVIATAINTDLGSYLST